MKRIISQYPWVTALVVVMIILATYFIFLRKAPSREEGFTVTRRTVTKEVVTTGKVVASENVSLAFENSGRVSRVNALVGTAVRSGTILLEQSNTDLYATVLSAEAELSSKQANLQSVLRGSRPEEISVAYQKVANSKAALASAKVDLLNALREAYTESDDAIRNTADQLFSNARGTSPKLLLSLADSQQKTDLESSRFALEAKLVAWSIQIPSLADTNNLGSVVQESLSHVSETSEFLTKLASVLNAIAPDATYSKTTLDGWRSGLATARATLDARRATIGSSEQDYITATSGVSLAEEEEKLVRAGSTKEDVAVAEAQVKIAEASLLSARARYEKSILRSPIAGIVSRQDASVGEIVPANTTIVDIISSDKFIIEAFVPESDISTITVGNQAKVILDAYGEDVLFATEVISFDPAETIIEGVSTYRTKFRFREHDTRIRSGMTATISIITGERKDVLSIPFRALVMDNELGPSVRVLMDSDGKQTPSNFKLIPVKIGLRGSDGYVEVADGLQEGDRIFLSLGRS